MKLPAIDKNMYLHWCWYRRRKEDGRTLYLFWRGWIKNQLPAIFDIINDQSAVVNDLTKGRNIEHLFFAVPVKLGYQHAQNRSPPFSPSVQQVPDRLRKTLGQALQVTVLLSVVKVVSQVFKVFFCIKHSRNDLFNSFGLSEFLRVLFEDLLNW